MMKTEVCFTKAFILNASLTKAEKLLCLLLGANADEQGETSIRQETLASEYGCSPRYIRRLLGEIRKKGALTWTQHGRYNVYRLSKEILICSSPCIRQKSPLFSRLSPKKQVFGKKK